MDYGKLPPDVHSLRMYSGPGAGPMRTAANAWDRLAATLHDTATKYRSATDGTAARFAAWLRATAAHAEHTAAHARAAARAYESALAATAPPIALIVNRSLRKSLVAENVLGQHLPAIAAAEAAYDKMWAQDVAAMYAYADAASAASTMTPFTSPGADPPRATRELLSAGTHVMSTLPEALRALSAASPGRFNTTLLSMSSSLSKLSSLSLGFAKHASVPIAVAVTGAARRLTPSERR